MSFIWGYWEIALLLFSIEGVCKQDVTEFVTGAHRLMSGLSGFNPFMACFINVAKAAAVFRDSDERLPNGHRMG